MSIDLMDRIFEIIAVGVPTAALGHWVASKKDKKFNEQSFIDQLQEERDRMDVELGKRDSKIDDLYEQVREMSKKLDEVTLENGKLKWEIEKKDYRIQILEIENEGLKSIITDYEKERDV